MSKLNSYLKCCLLCGEGTCENDDKNKIGKLGGIVGAVNCNLLERQLEKMFILLKILEVPSNWCEVTLQSGGGDGGEGDNNNNPDKWFTLCDKCVKGNVGRAWKAYQNILKWQTRMLSVRLQIREGMRRSILKNNQKIERGLEGNGGGQVDIEIKRYLFPELFTKVEQLEEMDFDFGNEKEDTSSPYLNSLSVESTSNKKYTGKRRGRPPKSDLRPSKYPIKIESLSSTTASNDPLNLVQVNFDLVGEGEGLISNDDDDDPHQDQDYQPEMEIDVDPEDQPEVQPTKPKRPRGRPPLPRRHTKRTTYYYRGTLKNKRFHWSICTICDARYPNTEDYSAHMALHSQRDTTSSKGPLDCPNCPFPARDPQELDYHLRRRHLKIIKKLKQSYSCPKCPFTTNRWKYFKEHVDSKHPTVPSSEFGSDLSLKCPECNKQHVNIAQYQKHLHTAHPQDILKGPVDCPSCGIKFLSQSLLNYHFNSVHERPLRYVCDECGRGFEFANHLKRHKEGHLKKRGALERKREHVCEECGMDFYELDTYRKHFKKQHNGGGGGGKKGHLNLKGEQGGLKGAEVFQCKYCEVKSSLASFIKRHVQEEHKGEMEWKCDKCERRYTNQQGLRRHERLNHGGDEVPCPYCGKKFKGEEYMRDHVKKFCKLKDLGVVGGSGGGDGGGVSAGLGEEQKYYPVEGGGGGGGGLVV